jgi:hypothetical protein
MIFVSDGVQEIEDVIVHAELFGYFIVFVFALRDAKLFLVQFDDLIILGLLHLLSNCWFDYFGSLYLLYNNFLPVTLWLLLRLVFIFGRDGLLIIG